MKTLDEIKQLLTQLKPQIQEQYHLTELGIFGALVKGEQNNNHELNILVDYSEVPSLFDLVTLDNYLTEKLGIKTSVVTKNGLKGYRKERILTEVIYL